MHATHPLRAPVPRLGVETGHYCPRLTGLKGMRLTPIVPSDATSMQGTNQNHLAIADATASRMHSHLEPGVDEPLIRMKSTWAATHAENSSRQHAHEDERRSHHQLQSSRLWCPLAGGRQTSDDRHILAVTNVARSEASAGDRLAAKHSTSARRFL